MSAGFDEPVAMPALPRQDAQVLCQILAASWVPYMVRFNLARNPGRWSSGGGRT